MKFMLFVVPTVPGSLDDRKRLRPIGRNNERYQEMLDELRKLAVFADDAGFDVFATTEHHFHSEGYETSVAPLLLYADLAARTKRIKFSPLGLVLPSWDPIRAAEELAVLDHLTKGRLYAGFARGYQDRWVNVLGQQYHVTGAPMDGSAIDSHNRRVYEETLKVIKKAWTEEAWEYDGDYYKVPFPYEEGIRRWPVADWTRSYGAPGGSMIKGPFVKFASCRSRTKIPTRHCFSPSRSARTRSATRRNRELSRGSSFLIRLNSYACAGFIGR
jgi:luciferase-like monooxygenase